MREFDVPKLVSTAAMVLLALLAPRPARSETAARYEAMFSDGTRATGRAISGWGRHPSQPRLDNTPLQDAKRPLRWLRDDSLAPWRPGKKDVYIEFVGGDRLVGRLAGTDPGAPPLIPPHLLVEPSVRLHKLTAKTPAYLRILPGRIQRLVLKPTTLRELRPGAVFYRNGLQMSFMEIRWKADSAVLLLKDGTSEARFSELAEVHLPTIDPWEAYYSELAVLSPDCRSRMIRIETTDGLIATSSGLRFAATPHLQPPQSKDAAADRDGTPKTWRHIVQPVWSLDALWVPFGTIRTRRSFAPHEVPLCRVPPESMVSPPFLKPRMNRNFAGRPLISGGNRYAWGFAVHAYSELRFPIPPLARAFRSDLGLDRGVGPGGCARGRVFVGSTATKPLYESPLLIGSAKTADSGTVALGAIGGDSDRLVLQADQAANRGPPGSDPSNIRDKLNWLDPRIELDRGRLRREVHRRAGLLTGASKGWKILPDRDGECTWTARFVFGNSPGEGRFRTTLTARGKPLKLSGRMKIGPADKWLAVYACPPTGENPKTDTVALHVNKRPIQPRKVPIRQSWQADAAPLLFDIEKFRGKQVELELTCPAGAKPLHWRTISTAADAPPAYGLVDILADAGKSDMAIPPGLGRTLRSTRIGKAEKLAAIKLSGLGGLVNYKTSPDAKIIPGAPANIMIDKAWTGGDKTFTGSLATFRDMPSLKMLIVTATSGVSDDAIAKLKAELPGVKITRFVKRTPAPKVAAGAQPIKFANRCNKEVVILWTDTEGRLKFSSTRNLEPGEEVERLGKIGTLYEAHYTSPHRTVPKDFLLSQPISVLKVTKGNKLWEIKPDGQ